MCHGIKNPKLVFGRLSPKPLWVHRVLSLYRYHKQTSSVSEDCYRRQVMEKKLKIFSSVDKFLLPYQILKNGVNTSTKPYYIKDWLHCPGLSRHLNISSREIL